MALSQVIAVASEPQHVFRALLHPPSLAEWWGCQTVIDPQVGGLWVGGWGEGPDGLGNETVLWAEIADLQPGSRLTFRIGVTEIRFEIETHPEGSLVTVSQVGYPAESPEDEQAGMQSWVDMLLSLKAWVEKTHPCQVRPPAPAPPPATSAGSIPRPAPPPATSAGSIPRPAPPPSAEPQLSPPPSAGPQLSPPPPSAGPQLSPPPPSAGPQLSPPPQPQPAVAAGIVGASDPYGAAEALASGEARVLDDGGFGVTDPHAVIKSWSKEQGFGYVTHAELGDVVFDYDGCDFEPAPGDQVLLLVISKAWNGKPKVKRIACPAKGSKLDK